MNWVLGYVLLLLAPYLLVKWWIEKKKGHAKKATKFLACTLVSIVVSNIMFMIG